MSVTNLRQGLNTYDTGVSGGSTPLANKIIDISQWAEALEPRKTDFLTWVGIGAPINQRPYYWGQSYRVATTTSVNEALDNSETGIDVATGMGTLFQQWTVFDVIDYVSGSTEYLDLSTKETMCVTTAPTSGSDTLTVTRGYSGTSAVSHSSGAKIIITGMAVPENGDFSLSPITRGDQAYNYFQRFAGGVKADKAAQNMPTWEHKSNPMLSDFEEETKRQKMLLNESLWRGGRYVGNAAATAGATFGGIDTYIVTNDVDLAGAKMTPRRLESTLRDLAKNTDGGPEGLTLWMGYETCGIFDLMLDPIRMANATDTTLNLNIERVKYRFGTFDIMASHSCPEGVVYGLRKENLKVHPFAGCNWQIAEKKGEQHGMARDEKYLWGDFTFVVEKEASMFRLGGFEQDLAEYEGYQIFG